MRKGLGEGAVNFTCAGRGTCNPSCPMYLYCHCGCGAKTAIAPGTQTRDLMRKGQPTTFQRGHNQRVNGGHQLKRSGIDVRVLLPDLRTLLATSFTQRNAAEKAGVSQSWISAVITGQKKRTRIGMALRLSEAIRGSRGLEAEWRVEERELERRKVRQAQERRYRRDHAGRHEVTHDRHACTHCGAKLDNPHSLWMHSRSKHGDTTQGKNQWSSFRVKR